MKNIVLTLAFMLMSTFAFANTTAILNPTVDNDNKIELINNIDASLEMSSEFNSLSVEHQELVKNTLEQEAAKPAGACKDLGELVSAVLQFFGVSEGVADTIGTIVRIACIVSTVL